MWPREPSWRSVMALPNFPPYRTLHAETVGSVEAAGIDVWWVGQLAPFTALRRRAAERRTIRNRVLQRTGAKTRAIPIG